MMQCVPSLTWILNNIISNHLIIYHYHDLNLLGGELILILQVAWSRPQNLRMNEVPKNNEHINPVKRWYFDPKSVFPGLPGGQWPFVPATAENYTKIHKKHPSPPLFRQTRCCSQALNMFADMAWHGLILTAHPSSTCDWLGQLRVEPDAVAP